MYLPFKFLVPLGVGSLFVIGNYNVVLFDKERTLAFVLDLAKLGARIVGGDFLRAASLTILICFVSDEEMFGSGEGHMFAPGSLKSCISDTQRKAMELAAEEAKKSGKTAPEPEESAAPAGGNTPDM